MMHIYGAKFQEHCFNVSWDIVAFVKECFHNAVEIHILGIFWRVFIITNLAPPKNFSGAKLFRVEDVISIEHMLCS